MGGRLRQCLIVDAPHIFNLTWRLIAPALKEKTRHKITFVDRARALQILEASAGPAAAEEVGRYMAVMRSGQVVPVHQPSEVAARSFKLENQVGANSLLVILAMTLINLAFARVR